MRSAQELEAPAHTISGPTPEYAALRGAQHAGASGMSESKRDRMRVVIAGGGVAAIETLLALRELAGQRVEITLISPEREFLYRPVTVAEAFERGEARSYALAEILGNRGGGRLVRDTLAGVEPDDHVAVTDSGERIPYDTLVVAAGALAREPFPGALTFRGRGDVPALAGLLGDLVVGAARSVALALRRRCEMSS